MNINNNTNITNQVAASISKLNLNSATKAFKVQEEKKDENVISEVIEEDKKLTDKNFKNNIDIDDIQKYANYMGENLSIDDINYGLMYGRSVIADYSV